MKFPEQDFEKQAHRVVDNTIERGPKVYELVASHFRHVLKAVNGFDTAERELENRAVDRQFIGELQSLLFDGMITEDALGRSYVVQKDVHYSILGSRSSATLTAGGISFTANEVGWFAKDAVNISFDLTPEQAVEYLKWKTLWVSGVENDEVRKTIKRRLIEAAKSGQTYREWLDEMGQYFVEIPANRPEVVFRTNLYTAYTMAQLEQIREMGDRFPLWRYVAIMDSATRPEHAALNGEVFRQGEGPYPPIDYNCRCTAQHLHTYQVDAERIMPSNARVPTSARRFDTKGAFELWLAKKQGGMNTGIRGQVEKLL